jgi:hypothetical protein
MFSTERMDPSMRYDLSVLRALVRLSRKGMPATTTILSERAGGEVRHVRAALRDLERAALVVRGRDGSARLTLAGLALAVASMPPAAAAVSPPRRAQEARRWVA